MRAVSLWGLCVALAFLIAWKSVTVYRYHVRGRFDYSADIQLGSLEQGSHFWNQSIELPWTVSDGSLINVYKSCPCLSAERASLEGRTLSFELGLAAERLHGQQSADLIFETGSGERIRITAHAYVTRKALVTPIYHLIAEGRPDPVRFWVITNEPVANPGIELKSLGGFGHSCSVVSKLGSNAEQILECALNVAPEIRSSATPVDWVEVFLVGDDRGRQQAAGHVILVDASRDPTATPYTVVLKEGDSMTRVMRELRDTSLLGARLEVSIPREHLKQLR